MGQDQPWWRHQMETFSALLALCEENPLATGENNRDTGDLRRHHAHCDVTLMNKSSLIYCIIPNPLRNCYFVSWYYFQVSSRIYQTQITKLGYGGAVEKYIRHARFYEIGCQSEIIYTHVIYNGISGMITYFFWSDRRSIIVTQPCLPYVHVHCHCGVGYQ